MRYWSYNEPVGDEVVTKSEEEILQEYYPYWLGQMVKKLGLGAVIRNYTTQDCIDDWVVVNWAWESGNEQNQTEESSLNLLS